jgi:lysophospholipase L1-like esterase
MVLLAVLPEIGIFGVLYAGYVASFRNFPSYFLKARAEPRFRWPSVDWRSVYDPYLLFRNAPNVNVGMGSVVTDRYGFVPNSNPGTLNLASKSPGTFRVFLIGGSGAVACHAGDNALTIAALLEEFLNGDDGFKRKYKAKRFEVVNGGVGGYTSTQEFLFASLFLVRYQPDMFIVYDGYNEWVMSVLRNWKPHAHAYAQELEVGVNRLFAPSGSFVQAVNMFTRSASVVLTGLDKYSYASFLYARDKIKFELGVEDYKFEDDRRSVRGPINRQSIEVYRQNIINMIGICEKNDIALLYLLQPSLRALQGEKQLIRVLEPALAHKNAYFEELEILFDQLRKYNTGKIRVASLTTVFDDAPEQPFFNPSWDLVHLNKAGNTIVAKRIADLLK